MKKPPQKTPINTKHEKEHSNSPEELSWIDNLNIEKLL
jgi:hypothetical protein